MVDTKVMLFDGAYHEVDSSTIAFEIAARTAVRDGAAKWGVKPLEPSVDADAVSPGDFVNMKVMSARRGVWAIYEVSPAAGGERP